MTPEDMKLAEGLAHKLLRGSRSADLEDGIQDAYIGAWKASQTWDASRGASQGSWLYMCVRREVIAGLRKRMRFFVGCNLYSQPTLSAVNFKSANKNAEDPWPEIDARITVQNWSKKLQRLPRIERIIVRGVICGLSIAEVSDTIGCSRSWGSRIYNRGINRLRNICGVSVNKERAG